MYFLTFLLRVSQGPMLFPANYIYLLKMSKKQDI